MERCLPGVVDRVHVGDEPGGVQEVLRQVHLPRARAVVERRAAELVDGLRVVVLDEEPVGDTSGSTDISDLLQLF